MRIISIELVGYKRMRLNGVERFSMKMTEIIQLILGTNGSGKSSLLAQLTPLPADASDFDKDGYKSIRITAGGNNYLLKNTFTSKANHSFIKNDDEELNPGGTITVQRELVKQVFNITQQRHDLLTGLETFHNMSPSRRREWFTELSDISYDYALEVYSRLKQRVSDTTGALKHAKKRLVAESAKVISKAEETKLREDVELTHKELNVLIEQSAPLDKPVAQYQMDQRQCMEEMTRLSNRLLRMRFAAPYGTHPYGRDLQRDYERDEWGNIVQPAFESIEQIEVYLDRLRHMITAKEVLINKEIVEHSKIETTVKILMKTGEEGVSALKEKLTTARNMVTSTLAQRKLGIEGLDPINAKSAFESVYDTLAAVLGELHENGDKRYSQSRLDTLRKLQNDKREERLKLLNELAQLNSKKEHAEAHKLNGSTECPKCHHTWIIGYSDKKFSELLEVISNKEEERKVIDGVITALDLDIESIMEYANQYKSYVACVTHWPVLKPFWDYLSQKDYIIQSPRMALTTLGVFHNDLNIEVDALKYQRECEELKELIVSAMQVGDANLTDMKNKLEESSLAIGAMTADLSNMQTHLADYTQYKRQLNEGIELSSKIAALVKRSEEITTDTVEMMRRETLNHCVRQLQHALAVKQETLSTAVLQKEIVADLENQVKVLAIEDEASKLVLKHLSPTDGLIAEGLLGFIKNYIAQMNILIRKIWSYPLQVLDCGVNTETGAELDYKFPMLVQTKSNIVPDVKLGSSGMQEIINLSFKIIAMAYMGLSDFPLYLDEFGKALDKDHRVASGKVIRTLMETHSFTQLFIISHYESDYGSFTNAEICVICPSNITVPSVSRYNQHVSIT